ncbi:MAG: methyltransferase [Candidatus Dormiibacterota bacterium]
MVSEDHAEQIRRWHDAAYQVGRTEGRSERSFAYLGLTLLVPPEVMPITPVSHLLGEAVVTEVHPGDRVLDMGTGCGVNAILAATQGADVLAVDIIPHALDAARSNTERNGLEIEVGQSDVFSEVEGRFDLIIFDPPFRWFAPRDLLEAAMTDENYHSLSNFFGQAREHLTESGRMPIFFGSSGDLSFLRKLIEQEGFTAEVVAQTDLVRDNWLVEYFTFRVTA